MGLLIYAFLVIRPITTYDEPYIFYCWDTLAGTTGMHGHWHWFLSFCARITWHLDLLLQFNYGYSRPRLDTDILNNVIRHFPLPGTCCLPKKQEALLSPSDRAMRLVSSNLANCHATVQKLLIRQVLTKLMVWSWRFSRRQCVMNNVHSTMTRPSRLPLSQV